MQPHEIRSVPFEAQMLTADTVQLAFYVLRSAGGYARLVRCRLTRIVKPSHPCGARG
jgi:hypothetical protein